MKINLPIMTFVEYQLSSENDGLINISNLKEPVDMGDYVEIDSKYVQFMSLNTETSKTFGSGPLISYTDMNKQYHVYVLPERFNIAKSISELIILCQLENPHD